MRIIYALEELPAIISKSIFLAGPTPRSNDIKSWRESAIGILKESEYDGVVFVPEPRDGKWADEYHEQVEWEEYCLNVSDSIVFWVPRDLKTMPAFTTNIEWGQWGDSGKVVFGCPFNSPKNRYLEYYAKKFEVPTSDSLKETLKNAMTMVGEGGRRFGGEREVPLYIWKTKQFQDWYIAQIDAGNRLDGAKVLWTFRVGPSRSFMFFWAVHVNMFIGAENRNKTNEVVISRPDISAVMMYKRNNDDIMESDIVLIREFRSPVRNKDCFIREIPGGSSFKEGVDPLTLASNEVKEETGIEIDPERISLVSSRQMVGTLSSHKAWLFKAELNEQELNQLRDSKKAFGVEKDTERTYVEVWKLKDILKSDSIDWSMLGMIVSVMFCKKKT